MAGMLPALTILVKAPATHACLLTFVTCKTDALKQCANSCTPAPTLLTVFFPWQGQQDRSESGKQVAYLTHSLKQAQSQAAALSQDKIQMEEQLQQQTAAFKDPAQSIPQVRHLVPCC